MLSAYVFVFVYILVDVIYVMLARPSYDRAVKAVSGEPIPKGRNSAVLAAILAYSAMAIGWLLLVVPSVAYMVAKGYAKWKAGLVAGLAYGFALYAVFNGSLYAMFRGWDIWIVAQDMIWGVGWTTILTTAYATMG
jgi:uncharacterized membrane protein